MIQRTPPGASPNTAKVAGRGTSHCRRRNNPAARRDLGVPVTDVHAWTHHGGCGTVGDRMLTHLRAATGHPAEFSVGFMSVLAGVLLAARAVQDASARVALTT